MTPSTTPASRLAAPYVEGLQRGVLRYQHCTTCGGAQTLARYACQHCGAISLVWRDAKGLGTVQAATVVARAPSDEFRPLAPYTLVLVLLDEGARLMAHAQPDVGIGDRVQAAFFEHLGQPLVRFGALAPP